MAISIFDLFKIGIGPSSSHTVGPMVAARTFASSLEADGLLARVHRLKIELFGSLGATGKGHGSPRALVLGLEGETPADVDVMRIPERFAAIKAHKSLCLLGRHPISFDESKAIILHKRRSLPQHPNGMRFSAFDKAGELLEARVYYSVGGGFVIDESHAEQGVIIEDRTVLPHPFTTAAELLARCDERDMSISELMMANELCWRDAGDIRRQLLRLWQVMQECVQAGCQNEGILPGGLRIERRAPQLHRQLSDRSGWERDDPLTVLDWVSLYALAVNEENAAGGRIVTAPTNGAAGIIPAVLHYFMRFERQTTDDAVVRFLLTAGAIGLLFKENASISGAEVGCQGEVGTACSMAAGALADAMGGTPRQVENAAEIAMEHNLGLTCDPIGGLVQIPCIERNAMASIKAISAARMALCGDGTHFVSLDKVIKTMRDTGRDMHKKYKETSRGGLALNVLEVALNVIEC